MIMLGGVTTSKAKQSIVMRLTSARNGLAEVRQRGLLRDIPRLAGLSGPGLPPEQETAPWWK